MAIAVIYQLICATLTAIKNVSIMDEQHCRCVLQFVCGHLPSHANSKDFKGNVKSSPYVNNVACLRFEYTMLGI